MTKAQTQKKISVDLFVSTQTEMAPLNSSIIKPVFAGAANKKHKVLGTIPDNSGKNISKLNPYLCELTTQYWAVHHSKADYIGFMHYRRLFNFSPNNMQENPFGEIDEAYLDEKSIKKYAIQDDTILDLCQNYDIITSELKDISFFPEHFQSMYNHWERAPHLFSEDLEACLSLVEEMYPEYAEYIESYMSDSKTAFCNMYILRKDLLEEYNEWAFSILDVFMKEWDTTAYSHQALRTPGHLAERLWNLWLQKKLNENPSLRVKELQVVKFEHSEPASVAKLPSKTETKNKPVIPVVFAADDAYTAMVGITIYSMLKNASSRFFYDIYLFESGISKENKERLLETVEPFKNAKLTFIDGKRLVKDYTLTTANPHISNETYYRFLIQEALDCYDKVLYLDSDLLVLDDISKLFATKLEKKYLAATRDIDYLGNLNMPGDERKKYSHNVLKLNNPYDYFQAGVLVLNTKALRKLHSSAEWLEIAATHPEYIYNDQDILNAECEGQIVYLDQSWNIMTNAYNRVNTVFSFAPAKTWDIYTETALKPKIIHYAGGEKPWIQGHCPDRDIYFAYARETRFYEDLLSRYASQPQRKNNAKEIIIREIPAPERPNLWSRMIDKFLPKESKRRDIITSAYHKMKG